MSVALNPALIGVMEKDASLLRVAIYLADQNPHRDPSLAVTSMTRSLLMRLARREDLVITQVVSRSSLADQEHATIHTRRLPFRTDSSTGRLAASTLHPWLVRPTVDLWYYPKGDVPPIANSSVPSVGTLRDAVAQHNADHYPESLSPRRFKCLIRQLKRSLKHHCCVLTVSRHAAAQLAGFCERYRINPPPIEVTYQGSDWELYRGDEHQKCDYVLHLASAMPHKRTNWLLHAWHQLQQSHVDLPKLKLVGKLDAEGEQIMESVSGVTLSPPLPQDRLRDVMGSARGLLLPSEIEGFGLPALEAYYVRTPVCYVRGTAVAEVVRDPHDRGAFDLDDIDSFRTAFDNVMGLSEDQVRGFSDAMYEQFSTERICDRVMRVMRESAAKAESS